MLLSYSCCFLMSDLSFWVSSLMMNQNFAMKNIIGIYMLALYVSCCDIKLEIITYT